MDQELLCTDCGRAFTFFTGEQQFFAQRQFRNLPKRCRMCRTQRRIQRRLPSPGKVTYLETTVNCARCGTATTVPFVPTQDRPVYCRECFDGLREASASV